MKLIEAMTTAATRFRDPQMLDTSADRWREYVQAARREFLGQVPSIIGHDAFVDIDTEAGEQAVQVPGLTIVYGLYSPGEGNQMLDRTTVTDLFRTNPEMFQTGPQGRPTSFTVVGDQIIFVPTPDAIYTYRLWGSQFAVDFPTDGSDDDTDFPEPAVYHDAYVEGALERRLIDDENPERATYAHGRFMDYVKLALSTEPSSRTENYPTLVDDFYG